MVFSKGNHEFENNDKFGNEKSKGVISKKHTKYFARQDLSFWIGLGQVWTGVNFDMLWG